MLKFVQYLRYPAGTPGAAKLKFHLILKWKRDSRPDYSNCFVALWRDLYADSARASHALPVTAGSSGADNFDITCRRYVIFVICDGPGFERCPTRRFCTAVGSRY